MTFPRQTLLAAAPAFVAPQGCATNYPDRPVKTSDPFGADKPTDVFIPHLTTRRQWNSGS